MSYNERIRNFDVDRTPLEDMVELYAVGSGIQTTYQTMQAEEPEWLSVNLRTIRRAIRTKVADALEKDVRELEARREALKPAEQKRLEIDQKVEAAKARLAALGQ